KQLVEALSSLGWIDGAHNKRVPKWVFTLPENYRIEFLRGFSDADGWTTNQYTKTNYHVELCNRSLVEDIKCLVDGLGWTSGNIRHRAGRTSTIKAGTQRFHGGDVFEEDIDINSNDTYTLTWHETPLGEDGFAVEKILSIESDGEELVYDITVDDKDHNFVCNGVVVHNSVADGARWIWKRLILLEDAVLIYKLCLRGDSQVWTPDGRKS